MSGILAALPRTPSMPGTQVYASLGVLWNFQIPFSNGAHHVMLAPGIEVAGDVGLGGSFDATHPVKFALRVPVRIGVELLLTSRTIGFQFMARPFFEALGYARNDGREVISPGFGLIADVGVMFYR